jgi:hypothetical protein
MRERTKHVRPGPAQRRAAAFWRSASRTSASPRRHFPSAVRPPERTSRHPFGPPPPPAPAGFQAARLPGPAGPRWSPRAPHAAVPPRAALPARPALPPSLDSPDSRSGFLSTACLSPPIPDRDAEVPGRLQLIMEEEWDEGHGADEFSALIQEPGRRRPLLEMLCPRENGNCGPRRSSATRSSFRLPHSECRRCGRG